MDIPTIVEEPQVHIFGICLARQNMNKPYSMSTVWTRSGMQNLCAHLMENGYTMLFGFFMVTIQHNNMKLEIKLGEIIPVQCVTHLLHSLISLRFASRQMMFPWLKGNHFCYLEACGKSRNKSH